jgi:uncharacterized membrane protein YfcA
VTVTAAILLGLAAGILAGLFGVGGGILFVPALVLLGDAQHVAIGTSLLAILPTALAGTWRHARYGNVRWRAALVIGAVAAAAAQGGVLVAEALPEATLRKLFGGLLVFVAAQVAWRARRG